MPKAKNTTTALSTSVDNAVDEVQAFLSQARQAVPERDSIWFALVLCAVVRTNLILYGMPGTGKSLLARIFGAAISGNLFDVLMTRFTTPAEMNGGVDVQAMKAGRVKRVTTGYMPEAHVAFLDEGFKANSAWLNSTLTAINEHKFHDDGKLHDIPLRVAMIASNEFADDVVAFDDRCPFRFDVPLLKSQANFGAMLRDQLPKVTAKISVANLELLERHAETIDISDDVVTALWELRHELEGRGIYVSDRKLKVCVKVMRACAVLNGDAVVTTSHLRILEDVLWLRPDDKGAVRELIAARLPAWENTIRSVKEAANKAEGEMATLLKQSGNLGELPAEIGRINKRLKNVAEGPIAELRKVPEAAAQLRPLIKQINRIGDDGRRALMMAAPQPLEF